MKLFGDSKKSKHTHAALSAEGQTETSDASAEERTAKTTEENMSRKSGNHQKKKKKMSGKRKLLIALGCVAGVLALVALVVVIFYKQEVTPPPVTSGLNVPSGPPDTDQPDPTDPLQTTRPASSEQTIRMDGVYTVLIAARDVVGMNTDAIMVARFDTRHYTLNVVSIPRDTLVNVSYRSKLVNAMYAYGGVEGLMEGITDLVGFRPDFYAVIKLSAIAKLIDAIGGVDYYVPRNMDYDDDAQDLHIHFKKGMTHMTGKKAVEYMRFRKGYQDADIGRIHAQQDFLTTMVGEILAKKNKVPVTDLVDIFFNDVDTSLSVGECAWFAKELLKMNAEDVRFDTMPGNYNDYYKGRSYVTVTLSDWLVMINEMINPFNVQVTSANLDVLTRNENGKMIATTGVFADSGWSSGSSGGSKPSSTKPSSTKPSSTKPDSTKPDSTKPSSQPTEPTETEPTYPPETDPAPSTDPTVTTPATDPPETEPPSTDPAPSTDPTPSTDPVPSTEPPETEPVETAPAATEQAQTQPAQPPETEPQTGA